MTTDTTLPATRFDRLAAHWVYGGALAGVLLLAVTPLIAPHWPRAGGLVWLCLIAYMLHQYEEHDADRFRRFVNDRLAGGADALTTRAVFWINIAGVWAVIAAALWLTLRVHPGWGLIAAYLLIVNALAHAGQAIALRTPNPGLWTGLILFLPLGGALWLHLWPAAPILHHALSLALVVVLHAAIFAGVARARKATRP
ncbi:MAG: HXXEE domain-containing protein [Rhodobacteraceae bacterium]|jgi:hypothetical protein|nr:HXXEE domain-containing protein [Paracoccaceae bacterium]